jgi:hypothetical protein
MRVVSIIALAILSSGCLKVTTPESYPSNIQEASKNVTLYEKCHIPDKKYSVIEKVRSHACDIKTAAQILKLEGAKVNADAVVNYECWSAMGNMISSRCRRDWKCRGDAVQFEK